MQMKRAGNLVGIVMEITTYTVSWTFLARKALLTRHFESRNGKKAEYTYNFGLVNIG